MRLCFVLAWTLAGPLLADEDPGGQLNPPEMGVARVLDNIRQGQTDMVTCASGYYITKSGKHVPARELFEACAEAGWTGAMTWMSQLDSNGLGAAEDPSAAAEWDRRAAAAGDPVGAFNRGLDFLRGHGVPRDAARGRELVDRAADAGLAAAEALRRADYDWRAVTPDADEERYAPRAF